MKIFYVAGGSYKSFYLNCFLKIKYCDLLIFNFDIIYDIDLKNFKNSVAVSELLELSKALNCIVLAGIKTSDFNRKYIVYCNAKTGVVYYSNNTIFKIENKNFYIGIKDVKQNQINKIIITENKFYPNIKNCLEKQVYIFCDKRGVTFVKNKKIIRKFNKYSKFILK